MSGKLAPSKSTVYISNLAFALTNNDLHKLLEKHGQVVRVTIMKDRLTRRSRGVAFALFLTREAAAACAAALDGRELFGRTLKASLARDNGRAAEFVRRREYPDKARCFECGEPGHLSYACPRNALGERPPPPKKPRKKKKRKVPPAADVEEEEECEDPREWSLAAAIEDEHERQRQGSRGDEPVKLHRQVAKDAYFSDEE